MRKEIETREDIELLVNRFYEKVIQDGSIGFIFNDVAKVNWEKQLPIIYNFFENLLFYTGSYVGNPMELHRHISRKLPLTNEHFQRWETLFCQTVDELFTGEKAELAKQRALSISTVMKIKILDASAAGRIF